ncbi:MAG: 8-oxo-dGTP diphosphatase [Armatimonadetes bacterium]|nr:8-oxo-dGTP diphosphatase [Armatimonadota bacterium]
MPYTPILATLAYIVSPDKTQVLLIHRTRTGDAAYGKYNGLGGKIERGENVGDSLRRELLEEAGITVTETTFRGTVSWPGFGKNGEDWLSFIFVVTAWEGEIIPVADEGTLSWQPVTRLLSGELPLWSGDKHFLPLVFDADPRPFHGVMPYANGEPVSWSVTRL